jgi:hypothetical protein
MTAVWWTWIATVIAILAFVAAVGYATRRTLAGALIDGRNRYSLSRFNILWWTTIVLSLVAAVAVGRFTARGATPFGFKIPDAVIGLVATVGGTTVASTAVKGYKDRYRPLSISASPAKAFAAQLVLQEEGGDSEEAIDVGKLQAFVITVLLGAGYCLTAAYQFLGRSVPSIDGPGQITALPDLDPTFVVLLALSASAYVGTKTVNRGGSPVVSVATYRTLRRTAIDQLRTENREPTGPEIRARIAELVGGGPEGEPPPGDPQPAPQDAAPLEDRVTVRHHQEVRR